MNVVVLQRLYCICSTTFLAFNLERSCQCYPDGRQYLSMLMPCCRVDVRIGDTDTEVMELNAAVDDCVGGVVVSTRIPRCPNVEGFRCATKVGIVWYGLQGSVPNHLRPMS